MSHESERPGIPRREPRFPGAWDLRVVIVGSGAECGRWARSLKQLFVGRVLYLGPDAAEVRAAVEGPGVEDADVEVCETIAEALAARPHALFLTAAPLDLELALRALDAGIQLTLPSSIGVAEGLAVARRARELGRTVYVSAPEQAQLAEVGSRIRAGAVGTVTGVTLVWQGAGAAKRLQEHFGTVGAMTLDALLPFEHARRVWSWQRGRWGSVVVGLGDARAEFRAVSGGSHARVLRVEGTRGELVVGLAPTRRSQGPRVRIVQASGWGRRFQLDPADHAFAKQAWLPLAPILDLERRPPVDLERALGVWSVAAAAALAIAAGEQGVVPEPIRESDGG